MTENYTELKITSQTLSPEEITEVVGLQPIKTWKPGDLRGKSIMKQTCNGWVFRVETPTSLPLQTHVEKLLEQIFPISSRLPFLGDKVSIYFSCVIYTETSPPLFFDKKTISQIQSLGASLDIDLYLIEEELREETGTGTNKS